jgi:hypothetical protein
LVVVLQLKALVFLYRRCQESALWEVKTIHKHCFSVPKHMLFYFSHT